MRDRRYLRPLGIGLLGLSCLLLAAYALDRIWLSDPCPPCHAEATRALPRFDHTVTDGLVRISTRHGLEFRARIAGLANKTGNGVILLHGFPETSIMWRPLIGKLARDGYRVVAYDQRGYSPGARPGSITSYAMEELVRDLIGVADAVGFQRFHLVGHDWGGVVSWFAADRHPERIASLTSLSMPHPGAFSEALWFGTDQLRRSAYAAFIWLPWLPEFVYGFNRTAYLKRFSWRHKSPEKRQEYVAVFDEPGALRAILNWYRANSFAAPEAIGPVPQPTLFIWGNQDQALGRVGADKTADYVDGPFRILKPWAGHFIMDEIPDTVVTAVSAHLAQWTFDATAATPGGGRLPVRGDDCATSKPHCLTVAVSDRGTSFRVENRCQARYRGIVRIQCKGWSAQERSDYRFDVGPGGSLRHELSGADFGECYHHQSVCAVD